MSVQIRLDDEHQTTLVSSEGDYIAVQGVHEYLGEVAPGHADAEMIYGPGEALRLGFTLIQTAVTAINASWSDYCGVISGALGYEASSTEQRR